MIFLSCSYDIQMFVCTPDIYQSHQTSTGPLRADEGRESVYRKLQGNYRIPIFLVSSCNFLIFSYNFLYLATEQLPGKVDARSIPIGNTFERFTGKVAFNGEAKSRLGTIGFLGVSLFHYFFRSVLIYFYMFPFLYCPICFVYCSCMFLHVLIFS